MNAVKTRAVLQNPPWFLVQEKNVVINTCDLSKIIGVV